MGYRFWDLYIGRRPAQVRWRAGPALTYYKDSMDMTPYSKKNTRRRFLLRFGAMPVVLTGVTVTFFYMVLKGHGWLHVIPHPIEGTKEIYTRLASHVL